MEKTILPKNYLSQNDTSKNIIAQKMTEKIPVVAPNQTIGEIEKLLVEKTKDFETITYIYVVDTGKKLVGVISIKELFRAPKDKRVEDLMRRELITISSHSHQEKAAALAIRHKLKAIPVIDKDGQLLGIVPSDEILNILHREHAEDILKSVGVRPSKDPVADILSASATNQSIRRLPWLIFGLAGGVIAAFVVEFFESTLKETIILMAFMPAIVYIADAVGSQSQTIFIRAIAINKKMIFAPYIYRETKIGLLIAGILGALILLFSLLWLPAIISIILGASFFLTICVSIIISIFLPWLFLKIKIDPAVASGPFSTIIRDISSLLIYFYVISLIL